MSESDVRTMRALVFEECSDANWEACKENWMRADSILWLAEHSTFQFKHTK